MFGPLAFHYLHAPTGLDRWAPPPTSPLLWARYTSADADFAIKSMTDCISDIRSWMISDNLMLNDYKTEFLIIGTRQQLVKVNINCIKVGSTDVCPVTVASKLMVWWAAHYINSAMQVMWGCLICIISNAFIFASICLENQRKCLSMHLLHLELINATVLCMGCPTTSLTNYREFWTSQPGKFIMRLGFATSHPLCVACIGYLLKPGYKLRYCLLRSKQFTALPLNTYAIY